MNGDNSCAGLKSPATLVLFGKAFVTLCLSIPHRICRALNSCCFSVSGTSGRLWKIWGRQTSIPDAFAVFFLCLLTRVRCHA